MGCASKPIDDTNANAGGDGSGGSPAQWVDPLGDGTLASVKLVEIYKPQAKVPLSATALAFNATIEGELWITLRQFPSNQPCTEAEMAGCDALPGVVAIVADATGDAGSAKIKEDGNSWHFMRRPTAISWGEDLLFGTCGEALTDNYEDDPTPYSGPVLWSSNPEVFGVKPTAGQNGTHLDMMHESPYCMGIAHESENAYWVFNGDAGSLDRYDFHAPHAIGGDYHSDGEVYRYVNGQLARTPEVPSHLVYDAVSEVVYVADTGNGRVLRVDPSTATDGGTITTYEEVAGSGEKVGATVDELVSPGLLDAPSGLALGGDRLYVTDNQTGMIYAFDLEGNQKHALDTGLPAGSLSGIALGPDGLLYFTDLKSGSVRRIEPQ